MAQPAKMQSLWKSKTVENPSSSTHVAAAGYAGCPDKTAKYVVSQPTLAQGVVTSVSVQKGVSIASSPIAATTVIFTSAHAHSMANNLRITSARRLNIAA